MSDAGNRELVRPPAVAGRFYPAEPVELAAAVAAYLAPGRAPRAAVAAMVPHAGWVYSGAVTGQVLAGLAIPPRVIVLAPNHTGRGRRIAVHPPGRFALPGGDVAIDRELTLRVLAEVPGAELDPEAHRAEHAIEVELPLLRARRPDVAVVAIVVGGLAAREAIALGEGLARAAAAFPGEVLVLASSDMSHYLPDADCRAADQLALAPLLADDPAGLYRTVAERRISMCGVIPATAMLAYGRARAHGAPELTAYRTSGETSGEFSQVVGYAGVTIPA